MTTDTQIDALHAAGLRVIVAGEDDKGVWRVSLARSRLAPMDAWKTGSGPSFEAALTKALSLAVRKPRTKPTPDFEELL